MKYYYGSNRPAFQIPKTNEPLAPNEDFSFHIEADWDGDPETMVICIVVRAEESIQSILTINPAVADVISYQFMVAPVSECLPLVSTSTLQWTAQDALIGDPYHPIVAPLHTFIKSDRPR